MNTEKSKVTSNLQVYHGSKTPEACQLRSSEKWFSLRAQVDMAAMPC